MNEFKPYSKETQLKGLKPKKEPTHLKTRTPLQAKKPMNKKRKEPRRTDKTRTNVASGVKKPTLYQRGTFGESANKIYETYGRVCGEKVIGTPNKLVPPCEGWLEIHHVKFKSGSGRGVFENGRPLCKAHHDFAHANFWYAEMWRTIHEQKFGEHYFKDAWDMYKEGLIDEPTDEKRDAFMNPLTRKTNWGL